MRDDGKFLPLGKIEKTIYLRRKQAGLPVFRDPQIFSELLQKLAAEYAAQRERAAQPELEEAGRRRLQCVVDAAAQLQRALEALEGLEICSLEERQYAAFSKWEAAHGGPEAGSTYWLVDGEEYFEEVVGARTARHILACKDLIWLREGAETLTPARIKGRRPNAIENKTAAKFLCFCHQSGWSPVQFANCGTEKSDADGAQDSDAILCLAAVFAGNQAQSDSRVIKCMTQAKSALRACRSGVEWDVMLKVGMAPYGDPVPEYKRVTLEISLANVKVRPSDGSIWPAFRRLAHSGGGAK